MSEQKKTVSVTPESDDFAARYDRMVAPGSGSWAVKILIAAVAALVVIALLSLVSKLLGP